MHSSIALIFIMALNFGVSWANCMACGRAWAISKVNGGFLRVLVWCGAIQSAIGFSSVFLPPLMYLAYTLVPQYFTADYLNGIISLWYITIIFPALGTGLIIMIDSWMAAYYEHSVRNLGVAAYNTFVQVHNTMGAVNSMGSAFQSVGKMFSGRGDAKGKALLLAIVIVVAAISAGIILTATLIHRYAGTVPLPANPAQKQES